MNIAEIIDISESLGPQGLDLGPRNARLWTEISAQNHTKFAALYYLQRVDKWSKDLLTNMNKRRGPGLQPRRATPAPLSRTYVIKMQHNITPC